MKIDVIPVKNLAQYMELVKKEMELRVKLTQFNEEQERQLKRLEGINQLATYLSHFKKGEYSNWYKQLEPELKKLIDKNQIF